MTDEAEHLLALDAVLGYMNRVLTWADLKEPFVRGYASAYGDVAHIRAVTAYDWRRRDREAYDAWAATQPSDHWAAVKAMPDLGKHRIFPREG